MSPAIVAVRTPAIRIALIAGAVALAFIAQALAGEGALARNSTGSLAAWIASVTLGIAACIPSSSKSLPPSHTKVTRASPLRQVRRREWIVVLVLFIGAFALRVVQNDALPFGWNGDEGSAGLSALQIVRGELTNMFGVGWYSFPALFFAIPALPIKLLGPTYGALRLPSALAGALTVVGLYGWMRSAYGWRVGLASAVMLAVSHYAIQWSRIGLNNVWDGVFVVFAGWCLWRGWRSGDRGSYVGAGLLVGLSQYFYTGSRALPLIIAAWLASMFIFERNKLSRERANVVAMTFIAALVFLPLGVYFVKNPAEFRAPTERVSLLRRDWPQQGGNWFQYTARVTDQSVPAVVAGNLRDAALGFVTLPLRSWYSEAGKPVLLTIPAILALLGLGWLIVDYRNATARFLLLTLAATIGIAAFSESTPAGQRYVAGVAVAAACVGLGVTLIGRLSAEFLHLPGKTPDGYALAAVVLMAGGILDLTFYFRDYAPLASRGDLNTQVATEIARRIVGYPDRSQLYFFGAPRMIYGGFSTMRFVAPQVEGVDVLMPLEAPPDWTIDGEVTAFAFVPERAADLDFVKRRYPGGRAQWINTPDGQPLALLYEITSRVQR